MNKPQRASRQNGTASAVMTMALAPAFRLYARKQRRPAWMTFVL